MGINAPASFAENWSFVLRCPIFFPAAALLHVRSRGS